MSTGVEDLRHDKPLSAKIEALAGYGISPADIALVLAVDEQDLKATYANELESGHIKANARVARACSAEPPAREENP